MCLFHGGQIVYVVIQVVQMRQWCIVVMKMTVVIGDVVQFGIMMLIAVVEELLKKTRQTQEQLATTTIRVLV
jgi:hypothetical protein